MLAQEKSATVWVADFPLIMAGKFPAPWGGDFYSIGAGEMNRTPDLLITNEPNLLFACVG